MSNSHYEDHPEGVEYGFCFCGCGEKTSLAIQTSARSGNRKGEPVRFRPSHARRGYFRNDGLKKCPQCKLDKPLDQFHIKADGKRHSYCDPCFTEDNRTRSRVKYAPIKEANAQKTTQTSKTCLGCNIDKDIAEFRLRHDRPGKREARCESCHDEQIAEERKRQYANGGRERASKRRALRSASFVGDYEANREYEKVLQNDPCCFCGSSEKIEIDHIEPLNPREGFSGDHDWSNLSATCSKCNKTKNNRPVLRFLLGQFAQ